MPRQNSSAQINDEQIAILNKELNDLIRKVMDKRTSSTIAKECGGKAVSTITRIRKGEYKRGIDPELLRLIWKSRDKSCDVSLEQLLSANSALSDAYMNKENARFDEEQRELEGLEEWLYKKISDSDYFTKKGSGEYELFPNAEIWPDKSYEIAFDNGERKHLLIFTVLKSQRRIAQLMEREEENKDNESPFSSYSIRHYRTILEFQELRTLHPEYKNAELAIIYNYENEFLYNAEALRQLSNTENVSLYLLASEFKGSKPRFTRICREICLDGRESGILRELNLVRDEE